MNFREIHPTRQDWRPIAVGHLLRGERVGVVAPTTALARLQFKELVDYLTEIKLYNFKAQATMRKITTPNDGSVIFFDTEYPESLRGQNFHKSIAFDEVSDEVIDLLRVATRLG